MSDEKTSSFLPTIFSLLPIFTFLGIDWFAMNLQPEFKSFPHLAFSLLSAQLICQLVFIKGEICPGQRARLSKASGYSLIFWCAWFILSLFSNFHYVFTDLICLCGIILSLSTFKQPQEDHLRHSILVIGSLTGIAGVLLYIAVLATLSPADWLQFNPIAQCLSAIVLAHLWLVIARNRLQGFMAVLPFVLLIMLLINAIASLIWLLCFAQQSGIIANPLSLILYFILHLIISAILAIAVFRKQKLNYNALLILLIMGVSLPLWAIFTKLI